MGFCLLFFFSVCFCYFSFLFCVLFCLPCRSCSYDMSGRFRPPVSRAADWSWSFSSSQSGLSCGRFLKSMNVLANKLQHSSVSHVASCYRSQECWRARCVSETWTYSCKWKQWSWLFISPQKAFSKYHYFFFFSEMTLSFPDRYMTVLKIHLV